MECRKCGTENDDGALECAQCGVILAKATRTYVPVPRKEPKPSRVGRILTTGLVAAIVVYVIPFTRFIFSMMVTLFHEFGHAVMGWLLGHPSLPAFDFVYGGGFTHMGQFRLSVAIAVACAFAYFGWLCREHKKILALLGVAFLLWMFFVTREWRRELAIAAAGHLSEFILAGVLFYKAITGRGWRNPDVERPLGAFMAFFVQIHSMHFAWKLTHDAGFLEWYREGKGGALMNDLEVVALDLQIRLGVQPQIEGVANALLVFSVLPMVLAVIIAINQD